MSKTQTKKRWEPSEAEKAAFEQRIEALQENLTRGVENFKTGSAWTDYLDMASKFHKYSPMNCLLIALQLPEASMVASATTWRKLGRYPAKGSQGLLIRRPNPVKVKGEDKPDGTEGDEKVLTRFKWASTFDISMTEGKDLPDVAPTLLEGEAPVELWDAVVEVLAKKGYSVVLGKPNGSANASVDPGKKQVVVRADVEPKQQLKSLLHECGHTLLGHVDDLASYQAHRGIQEVEAESVAYVVSTALGFDSSSYSVPYLSGWGADAKAMQDTATRVVKVSHEILGEMPEMDRLTLALEAQAVEQAVEL